MSLIVMLWQKRALDPPLTLTELPDVHYLALEQRNSLLVWILPFFFLRIGADFWERRRSPQPWLLLSVSLGVPCPNSPPPSWGLIPHLPVPSWFLPSSLSLPSLCLLSLPLFLPLPLCLTRTLCLFSCLHLGPADTVITLMHVGFSPLPPALIHSLTHNVPS